MNRRDKLKNINMFNANLKLEQKHILENSIKIFVNNSLIEACVVSTYFDSQEKSFMIGHIIPNLNRTQLTEGPLDWFKTNILEPTGKAIKKGIEGAKSFGDKIIGIYKKFKDFIKSLVNGVRKAFSWLFKKAMEIGKKAFVGYKEKINKSLENFKKIPKKERDTEIEQLKLTYDFWKGQPDKIMSSVSSSFNDNINENVVDWHPEVIDYLIGNNTLINESKGMGDKFIGWITKILSMITKPFILVIEKIFSFTSRGLLYAFSWFTSKLGGPGPHDFKNLTHLLGGILFTIFESIATFISPETLLESGSFFIEGVGHVVEIQHHVLESVYGFFIKTTPGVKHAVHIVAIVGIVIGLVDIIMSVKHMTHAEEGETDTTNQKINTTT